MVEDGIGTFPDLVNEEDYKFIQENIDMNSLDIMNSQHLLATTAQMDPILMNVIDTEETLSMDDFKYHQFNTNNRTYQQQSFPNFPPGEPQELCNTDYAGPKNFEVLVDPNGLKNPWEYSPQLNKIYIDIKHKFPINFSVKSETFSENLFVRVMPMFEEDRYFQELVHRCICHEQPQDPLNRGLSDFVIQHIIRCENASTQYFGDKNMGKRLSMVIPLSSPQAGTDSVKEFFQFVCKSSCVGGMNRRPIQVIFTLENEFGIVLGRRVLRVRICSCPKRDREKEEMKTEKNADPPSKKKKIEKKVLPSSTEIVDTKTLPLNLNIVGEENYKEMLKCAQRLMSHQILKLEGRNGADAPFRKCLNDVNAMLGKLE